MRRRAARRMANPGAGGGRSRILEEFVSLSAKPLWLEGMFLRPQHLQQYDRWIESTLEGRVNGVFAHAWGVRRLEIDQEALKNGQLRLSAVEAILPDGTIYSAPSAQPLPPARHVDPDFPGKQVYLALPLRNAEGTEVAENGETHYRFTRIETQARNNAQSDRPPADIVVGNLNVRLVLEGEPLDELVHVPVAEIESVGAQGQIVLSDTFIPPVLTTAASARLISILEQIRGLLKSRASVLASGATGQGGIDRAGMLDLMNLGIVNRYETVFNHLVSAGLHAPETVYRECLAMIGELSAYAAAGRRPPDLPPYNHLDLRATFEPLLAELRALLSVVVEQNAVNIPLTEREYGIWLGEIDDRVTFQSRRFVLIVQANVALDTIRAQMPIQIKVGPVEQIRELVNLQLPGIGISPLPVAPREIPFIQNAVYFELDRDNALWAQFPNSAAFALHVSGNYPGLGIELWAVQKG